MCVRECPAKAIRISGGVSEVVPERCIGCGHCVRVCSQHAKQVLSSVESVLNLLKYDSPVVAVLDPAFPAEFHNYNHKLLIGMLRELGFAYVHDGAFGFDLIANRMKKILKKKDDKNYISSHCPAVYYYVTQYHAELSDELMPLVSPMIASARAVKKIHGEGVAVVYISPCIASKGEAASNEMIDEIDEVLTFKELKELFKRKLIFPNPVLESDFDHPLGGLGALSALVGGLPQSVELYEDLLESEVVTAAGRIDFTEAIKEFKSEDLKVKLLEALCCKGCIMGAGMTTRSPLYRRRARISKYVREVVNKRDKEDWAENIEALKELDLSRSFAPNSKKMQAPSKERMIEILKSMEKTKPQDELNCRACGYSSCRELAIAIHKGLAEKEMCLPYVIDELHYSIKELNSSNKELTNTKEALRQSEKLAGMGQLAAGIAHELNNPLGAILMYSNILMDEISDDDEKTDDLKIISTEAERCKKIVGGLLNFSRKNKVVLLPVNISELIDRCVKISNIPEHISLQLEHDKETNIAEIDKDQIIQVISNLINNGIEAMPKGGALKIITKGTENNIQIIIKDTGSGIAQANITKIFEPFFTTKQIGKGTGLGLAVSYGIIKMHRGKISVSSNDNLLKGQTGTEFTISLPRKGESSFKDSQVPEFIQDKF
jgi:signal transduction histidine kinase/iron only hydrogenase large subunit-like protein